MLAWILVALAVSLVVAAGVVAALSPGSSASPAVTAQNDSASDTSGPWLPSTTTDHERVLCIPVSQLPVRTLGRSGAVRAVRSRLLPQHEWIVLVEDPQSCEAARQHIARAPDPVHPQRTSFGVRVMARDVRAGSDAALWAPSQDHDNEPWPELAAAAL